MKKLNLFEEGEFREKTFHKLLVDDSPYMRILNFNFEAGQELPVHSHEMEGKLAILVLEGEGEFLSSGDPAPAKAGDVVVGEIAEPHGVRAISRMRVLVVIAPPV